MAMTAKQCYDGICTLSKGQGFYGRIKEQIDNLTEESRKEFDKEMEKHKFNDIMDMIFFFEC